MDLTDLVWKHDDRRGLLQAHRTWSPSGHEGAGDTSPGEGGGLSHGEAGGLGQWPPPPRIDRAGVLGEGGQLCLGQVGALCLRSLHAQRPHRLRARLGERGPQHSTGDPPQLRHPGPPPWRRAQASACHTKRKNIPYKTVRTFRLHMVYDMCVYILIHIYTCMYTYTCTLYMYNCIHFIYSFIHFTCKMYMKYVCMTYTSCTHECIPISLKG